jgi:hypothetical protein
MFEIEDVHDLDAADAQDVGDQRAMAAPPDGAVRARADSSSSSSRPAANSVVSM